MAIIALVKYEATGKRAVIPGLCVEATVKGRSDPTQRHDGPVCVGCDLNAQVQRPRNDDEQDDAVRMCEEWQRRGSSPVVQGKDTRKEGRRRAELDYIIAGNATACKWGIEVRWTDESDHAWLCSRAQ